MGAGYVYGNSVTPCATFSHRSRLPSPRDAAKAVNSHPSCHRMQARPAKPAANTPQLLAGRSPSSAGLGGGQPLPLSADPKPGEGAKGRWGPAHTSPGAKDGHPLVGGWLVMPVGCMG